MTFWMHDCGWFKNEKEHNCNSHRVSKLSQFTTSTRDKWLVFCERVQGHQQPIFIHSDIGKMALDSIISVYFISYFNSLNDLMFLPYLYFKFHQFITCTKQNMRIAMRIPLVYRLTFNAIEGDQSICSWKTSKYGIVLTVFQTLGDVWYDS